MLYQVKHIYQFLLAYLTLGVKQEPRLLSLDAFLAHLTFAVRNALKAQKTTVSIVLAGCTRYVQVLDVSLNKLLKDLIKEEQDNYYNLHIEEQQQEKYNIRERRILLTHQVARAWKRLHLEYKDTIVNTFRNVRLSLNPNGSDDKELKVKGILNISVRNYHQDDGLNQKEDGEEALALAKANAVEEERYVIDSLAEGDKDSEDQDLQNPLALVTDILRPNLRSKRLLAVDRYYLS